MGSDEEQTRIELVIREQIKTAEEKVEEKVEEDKVEQSSNIDIPTEETVNDVPEQPLISVDTEPSVKFAEVNTVFNYESENDLQETNLEEFGEPIDEEKPNEPEQSIDFEELE